MAGGSFGRQSPCGNGGGFGERGYGLTGMARREPDTFFLLFFSLPYFSLAVRADSGFWGTLPRSNYRVRECDVAPSRNFIHAHDKRISGEELGYPCLGSAFPRRARWAFVGDRNTGPGPGPRTFGDRRVWAAAGAAWFVTRREGCHNSYLERRRQQRRCYFSSFLVSGTV